MYLTVHLGHVLPFTGLMESLEFSVYFTTASPPSLINDSVCLQKGTLYVLRDVET